MNAARLAVDALERFGDFPAIHFEGREFSSSYQMENACRLACVLRAEGVRPGDRVIVPQDPVVAGAVGRPLDGIDLRIVDDQKQVLGAQETGEICIRGPNVMLGYWCDEGASRAAIVDDWFYTGDLGHVDDAGYVYVSGRKKDLIIKGGENISPREIEEALHRHPAVAQAAVIGLPHRLYGEDVAAVVILKSGERVSPETLREHAARYVTKFKIPSRIQFREELPKTGSGKILKRRLRDEWVDSGEGNEA